MHPIAIMLIAQSSVGLAGDAGKPIDFDLKRVQPPRECAASGSDIVVCRKRRDDRIAPLPDIQLAGPPKAEAKIFGDVKAGVGMDGDKVGGFQSNRVMAKIRIPL